MKLGLAFLAGLAGGAALGLIFSARSGKETRNAIRRKAQDSVEQIAAATGKVSSQVKDAAKNAKEQVTEAVEAGKQAYRAQTAGG
jgi:gas vesicle protein